MKELALSTDWVGVATVAVETVATVASAIAVVLGLRAVRRELWLHTFTSFADRYDHVFQELPEHSRVMGYDLSVAPASERDAIIRVARRYLNLCAEEYFLNQSGYLNEKCWKIWSKWIANTFRIPALRQAYDYVKDEFYADPDFLLFIRGCVEASRVAPGRESPGASRSSDIPV